VFSGGYNTQEMRIDRAGVPFIGGAAVLAALCAAAGFLAGAAAATVLAGFFVFFFRDPDRRVVAGPDDVVSPADGRVMVAGASEPGVAPSGDWLQISIFLSPLDVHVNRIPASGRVTRVEYKPGRFLPAYRPNAARDNERNEVWIDHESRTVVCRQVVGVLARRIVCRIEAGVEVTAGQRFGVMKFGSRMDVYVPPGSQLRVAVGDRVCGGESLLAVLPPVSAGERSA
jgi:phosphatidylserine decarboxylase